MNLDLEWLCFNISKDIKTLMHAATVEALHAAIDSRLIFAPTIDPARQSALRKSRRKTVRRFAR